MENKQPNVSPDSKHQIDYRGALNVPKPGTFRDTKVQFQVLSFFGRLRKITLFFIEMRFRPVLMKYRVMPTLNPMKKPEFDTENIFITTIGAFSQYFKICVLMP